LSESLKILSAGDQEPERLLLAGAQPAGDAEAQQEHLELLEEGEASRMGAHARQASPRALDRSIALKVRPQKGRDDDPLGGNAR
jgi:hypothetical protein